MPESKADDTAQRPGRHFPWVCPRCRKKEVRPVCIPYRAERLHDGRLVTVEIPELKVPKCGDCGELVFNYDADEQIMAAIQAQAAMAKVAS